MNVAQNLSAALVVLLLGSPLAWSQQPARVAWLGAGSESGSAAFVSAFKEGMRENDLFEGKHYVVDARWADRRYDRLPSLAVDLLKRDPAVIMVTTIASVRAAQRATRKVPIVMMTTNDPVGAGLIASLARPGGNTTGVGTMAEDIAPKYVEMLRAFVPKAKQLAVLVNADNPTNAAIFEQITLAARHAGIAANAIRVVGADDLAAVFEAIALSGANGLAIASDQSFLDQRVRICNLAHRHRLLVLGYAPEFTDAGCVAGFGASRSELHRRAATYVAKILRGANPAELPVEQPTRFILAVDVKNAKALGLALPQSLLLRADRVIE